MKTRLLIIAFFVAVNLFSQEPVYLKPGDQAPNFIVTVGNNSIRSFLMPHMKRLVLLHFWSSESYLSRMYGKKLRILQKRYQNTIYRSADGFDIIAIAVQSDIAEWNKAIAEDSLGTFINGIARKGLTDDVCRNYGVTTLPTQILIDESGTIVAVDPGMSRLEDLLDERKNFQPIRKDITGKLALSSNSDEALKYSNVYLFNRYGDSIAKTRTSESGKFFFSEIKLSQDFVLKVDNKSDIITSHPIALYGPDGDFIMDGRTNEGGFVFYIPTRSNNLLTVKDTSSSELTGQLTVVKDLSFKNEGRELTLSDERELSGIIAYLKRDKKLKLEFITHTDSRLDSAEALDLTARQAITIKNYFNKKGIPGYRVTAIARGNMDLRKLCGISTVCSEDDHRLNRRVELQVYSD